MTSDSYFTYWLFGPKCDAMPKLTARLRGMLTEAGHRVRLLTEQDLRLGLCADLGFSEADQLEVTRRAAHMARSHLHAGDMVVVGTATATSVSHHQLLREILGKGLRLVHVECERSDCSLRQGGAGQSLLPARAASLGFEEMDAVIRVPEQSLEEALPQLVAMATKGAGSSQTRSKPQLEPEPPRADLSLSAREAEILRLVSQGQRNKEIATTLGISSTTVRTHLERAYRKLSVSTRAEAVSLFVQHSRPQGLATCPPIG